MRIAVPIIVLSHRVLELLAKEDLDLTAVAHITALLGNMNDFAAFNQIYSTMFGTSPPARACVAVDLPQSHSIVLECIAYKSTATSDRQALHVQGISYWAPANIGPYSQAISASHSSSYSFFSNR